jgi:23S rRNA (cytosine1962-C5)-methyltransferase
MNLAALDRALSARANHADVGPSSKSAIRLMHGPREGVPWLSIDRFGRTIVVYDASPGGGDEKTARDVVARVREAFPDVRAAVWKRRNAAEPGDRNGIVVHGSPRELDDTITEDGVRYALSLTMNRDASLYLDTRELRAFLRRELAGAHVLNAFAYTGSLGVAARMAPAARAVQLDRTRAFLEVGMRSCALNGLPAHRADFLAADYFEAVARLKREGRLFDAVIVDPPFFSESSRGRIDLVADAGRVLDKARPLVGDGGRLIVVNNAVFVSGAAFLSVIERVCESGYFEVERRIDAPWDFTVGEVGGLPADPAPFNHSTKIVVLRGRRKDGRRAPGGPVSTPGS